MQRREEELETKLAEAETTITKRNTELQATREEVAQMTVNLSAAQMCVINPTH